MTRNPRPTVRRPRPPRFRPALEALEPRTQELAEAWGEVYGAVV